MIIMIFQKFERKKKKKNIFLKNLLVPPSPLIKSVIMALSSCSSMRPLPSTSYLTNTDRTARLIGVSFVYCLAKRSTARKKRANTAFTGRAFANAFLCKLYISFLKNKKYIKFVFYI